MIGSADAAQMRQKHLLHLSEEAYAQGALLAHRALANVRLQLITDTEGHVTLLGTGYWILVDHWEETKYPVPIIQYPISSQPR
jgi:hypothetical protein